MMMDLDNANCVVCPLGQKGTQNEYLQESPDNRDLPSTSTAMDIMLKNVPDHTLPIGTYVTTAWPNFLAQLHPNDFVKFDASFGGERSSHEAYDSTNTSLLHDTDGTEICPKRFKAHPEIKSITDVIKILAEMVDETSDFSICVTRDRILEMGLKQWQRQKKPSPKNTLRVTFTGEAGIDNDTLRKDFLTEMVTGIEKTFFEGGENGKTPKYSVTDMEKHNFKTVGEIFAVSITHGGPSPNFFMEWCYNYISTGEMDLEVITERDVRDPVLMELIKEIKAADNTTLMECSDRISLCGYKGEVSIQRKEDIVRSVVLHARVRLVPMLQQICSGMKLYGLLTLVQQEKDICRQLFVPASFTKASNKYLKSLSPVFIEKGTIWHQTESKVVFFPQDIEDEEEGKNNREDMPKGETKDEEVDKAEEHISDTPINDSQDYFKSH
ncbi:hypothetical protein QQF64_019668 [Cirrhinus molitorella]|uniref:HECT domain-containing protein n=1 Tax=Cirrhinus molitorella TaxID=172907 RepID=A0ABR3LG58_9TELE